MSEVLVLRTCCANGSSYNGFIWPLTVGAEVIAPDWDSEPRCGGGLHGALHGEGDGSLFNWDADAKWLVVEVDVSCVVDLNGKVKFPRCVVRHVGNQRSATDYIMEHDQQARAVIGALVASGDRGTSTSGYRGTSTSGDGGIVQIKWYDGNRYRIATGYVGENGIEPNVAYRCDEKGQLVRA